MKAFELRAILSRIDPQAELYISTAPLGDHGAFSHPVTGVSQDRTVRVSSGDETKPVFVLHHTRSEADKRWAAKAHGEPTVLPGFVLHARCGADKPGVLMLKKGVVWPENGDFVGAWSAFNLDVKDDGDEWGSPFVFSDEEAAYKAAALIGLAVASVRPPRA
jgi:hypothetical protein